MKKMFDGESKILGVEKDLTVAMGIASAAFALISGVYSYIDGKKTSVWQATVLIKLEQISHKLDAIFDVINRIPEYIEDVFDAQLRKKLFSTLDTFFQNYSGKGAMNDLERAVAKKQLEEILGLINFVARNKKDIFTAVIAIKIWRDLACCVAKDDNDQDMQRIIGNVAERYIPLISTYLAPLGEELEKYSETEASLYQDVQPRKWYTAGSRKEYLVKYTSEQTSPPVYEPPRQGDMKRRLLEKPEWKHSHTYDVRYIVFMIRDKNESPDPYNWEYDYGYESHLETVEYTKNTNAKDDELASRLFATKLMKYKAPTMVQLFDGEVVLSNEVQSEARVILAAINKLPSYFILLSTKALLEKQQAVLETWKEKPFIDSPGTIGEFPKFTIAPFSDFDQAENLYNEEMRKSVNKSLSLGGSDKISLEKGTKKSSFVTSGIKHGAHGHSILFKATNLEVSIPGTLSLEIDLAPSSHDISSEANIPK